MSYNVGDRVQTDFGPGTVTRVHRPGTLRVRYNVLLDEPPEDDCGLDEPITTIDVGEREIEALNIR